MTYGAYDLSLEYAPGIMRTQSVQSTQPVPPVDSGCPNCKTWWDFFWYNMTHKPLEAPVASGTDALKHNIVVQDIVLFVLGAGIVLLGINTVLKEGA